MADYGDRRASEGGAFTGYHVPQIDPPYIYPGLHQQHEEHYHGDETVMMMMCDTLERQQLMGVASALGPKNNRDCEPVSDYLGSFIAPSYEGTVYDANTSEGNGNRGANNGRNQRYRRRADPVQQLAENVSIPSMVYQASSSYGYPDPSIVSYGPAGVPVYNSGAYIDDGSSANVISYGNSNNSRVANNSRQQRYRRRGDPPQTQLVESGPISTMVYQPSTLYGSQGNNSEASSQFSTSGGKSGTKQWKKPSGQSAGSGRLKTSGGQRPADRWQHQQGGEPPPLSNESGQIKVGNTDEVYGDGPGAKSGNPGSATVRRGTDRLYRHPRQPNHQPRISDEVRNSRREERQKMVAEVAARFSSGGAGPSSANLTDPQEDTMGENTAVSANGFKARSKGQRRGPDDRGDDTQRPNNNFTNTSANAGRKDGYDGWRNMPHNNFNQANKRPSGGRHNNGRTFNWRDREHSRPDSTEVCQRERLTEQLAHGSLECLVCCDKIRSWHQVWSCFNCHHILHLKCVVKWASTSKGDKGWRCPACQNFTMAIPSQYTCMCGKVIDPPNVPGETPHCCGDVCGKVANCRSGVHPCTLPCHPGPCPRCMASIERNCNCGQTSQIVQCSSKVELTCSQVCLKSLNCTRHLCQQDCHTGDCPNCLEVIVQSCFCGTKSRQLDCGECPDTQAKYSCGGPCPGKLTCGNHACALECHEGECAPCPLDPAGVVTCPCSKTPLLPGDRMSCLDPVPTCGSICEKLLSCGPPGSRHICQSECHPGECPACPLRTSVTCRCGSMKKELPCTELTTHADDARCQKKCSKKRSCGKHKCNQPCCIDLEHACPLPCNKTLSCGQHRCQDLCHRGHCLPCTAASFEELRCECGASVILPPVACGTRPPQCSFVCTRSHPCDHTPLHTCHSLPMCPPCSILTTKKCHGGHEMRKTVPCHISDFSCGRPCGKPLGCGHSCIRLCHVGDCLETGGCTQRCREVRAGCGHPCGVLCHSTRPCPVPPPPCLAQVRITCQCGRRTATRSCSDNASEYRRIATSLLASKMADVQLGLSVDVDINCASKMSLKTLECDDECKLYERNLRLAIGLQIANPDLSSKLHPRYSDFMRTWAKKNPTFCQMVHDQLTQLVQLAKESKLKSRSYSFNAMNREKRRFIHEYCKHFGCESLAYDMEPNRNIVATAVKDKCWLPSYSLLQVLERENGKRKVPLLPSLKNLSVPYERDDQMKTLQKGVNSGGSKPSSSASSATEAITATETPEDDEDEVPLIDYFDYTN